MPPPLSTLTDREPVTTVAAIHADPILSGEDTLFNIQEALARRQSDYDVVLRKARARGTAGGALQGGLLGILLTGQPEGAIAGGIAGGIVGYGVSGQVATKIVEEHRNFLVRQWSLQAILEAARNDTADTRFDLLLSDRVLSAVSSETSGAHLDDQSIGFLTELERHAEARVVSLSEVINLFDNDEDGVSKLSDELREQVAMLGEYRSNLKRIVRHHE